jgi:excisionase family DNA binding protein
MAATVEREFLTIPQAAIRYAVSVRTISRWLSEGRLPKIALSKRIVRLDRQRCDEAIRRFTIQEITSE